MMQIGINYAEGEGLMKYKAVMFDLFETLITEWGNKKYRCAII